MNRQALRVPILLAAVLVAGAALLGYLNAQNNQDWGSPSTYSARQFGGKAAYLLLIQSGFRAERWNAPPQQLPSNGTGITLVLAGAESYPRQQEAQALERFVRSGGRLIVTGWFLAPTGLPSVTTAGPGRVGFAECQPSALTRLTRAGTITQEGDLYWGAQAPGQVVHYRDEQGHAVVVSYTLGNGEVIWWASPLPLTNIGIRDRGNLDLLLYSLGEGSHGQERRILWDEYYHTQHHAARLGHYALVLRWAECQGLLLGAVLLFAYARRSGPVVPVPAPSRLSPLEFVQTMGSVFHKADARLAPLEIAFARLRQLAARRLSLPPKADAEEIAEAMQRRYGAGENQGVSQALAPQLRAAQNAMQDPGLSEAEAIQQVKTIHQVIAKLEREQKRNG